MARNTEPQLTAPHGMEDSERASLALFLGVVREHAVAAAETIKSYSSTVALVQAASETTGDEVKDAVLRVTGPIFEADIDLDVDVDGDTVLAMRRAISSAERYDASADERRLVRMAVFAGEVASWQAMQEAAAPAQDSPATVTSFTDRMEMGVAYIDGPLSETA